MIHYKLSLKNPSSHYIDVDLTITDITTPILELQLPSWRPGRYELGNFAKNIKRVDVVNENGKVLNFTKKTKDLWLIETANSKQIKVTYSYYTSEINAGNCYADETQVYVNPVHLCMYVPSRMDEQHVIELDIADDYKIATSLHQQHKTLTAQSFDELADSPSRHRGPSRTAASLRALCVVARAHRRCGPHRARCVDATRVGINALARDHRPRQPD